MSDENNKVGESQEDDKVGESQESVGAPVDGGDNTPEVSDGEILDEPPVEESKASSSKDDGMLQTHDGERKSANGAQRAENEFILVEDVDSVEGDTGHKEDVIGIEDDMEHGEGEEAYEEEDLSAEQRDIHDVVNEVLDTKLESFQAQIQKMFTMMQGSMDGPPGKGATTGGPEGPDESVGEADDDDDIPVQSGREGDDKEAAEQRLSKHQQKEWKEFLGQVSSILDLECASVTHASVLDQTVGSAEKVAEYLPAEGIVKNSWGKVKGKLLKEITQQCNKNTLQDYPWPAEDMDSYGNATYANQDLIDYLKYVAVGTKPAFGLQGRAKRYQADFRGIDGLFRYQQRVMSYASYFTAALGKLLAAEQLVEKDKIEEVLKNLGQCLMDASDTCVNGSVLAARSSRRLFIDALEISQKGNPSYLLNLPIAKKLFPSPELNDALLNFGINLEQPHLSRGGFTGRGSFGHRGRSTRGAGRGFSPRGRGAYARGRPSSSRGAMRGRGGPPSREGYYDQARESSVQSPSRGRGTPPRERGGYQRGRGPRGARSRGWQPRNRGRGRGRPDRGLPDRGLKRSSHDDRSFAEKHRRVDRIPSVDPSYSSRYERGTSPQRRQSFSPQKRDRGIDYQSIPDDPSSYYRSPSDRQLSPRSSHNNEGWY